MINENRNFLIHPSFIALGLLLMGVTALFVGFSFAYIYTRVQSGLEPLQLPVLFIVNTLILLASSYVLVKSMDYYRSDETEKYKKSLGLTLLLTLLFLASQIVAWKQLLTEGIAINHSNMASYLYIISGVHFAHVIAGIPFLAVFYYRAVKQIVEPISVLVYFTDPVKKRHLKMMTLYWHFLDALWIYLVVFFLVNMLF
jgi:cytochrome c oxidase subunit 3